MVALRLDTCQETLGGKEKSKGLRARAEKSNPPYVKRRTQEWGKYYLQGVNARQIAVVMVDH